MSMYDSPSIDVYSPGEDEDYVLLPSSEPPSNEITDSNAELASDSESEDNNYFPDYSEQECIALTNSLNAEIEQISKSIVDAFQGYISLSPSTNTSSHYGMEKIEALGESGSIKSMLGERAYKFFLNPKNRHEVAKDRYSTLTRYAIQAILAGLCEEIVNMWSFNKDEHVVLLNLYNSLCRTSSSSTSPTKWKSLTRGHTKISSYFSLKADAILSFAQEISKILVLVGTPWSIEDAREVVTDYFKGRLGELYDCCFRLDRVISEGIRAFDIEVYRPLPEEPFDEDTMDCVLDSRLIEQINVDEEVEMRVQAETAEEEENDLTTKKHILSFNFRLGLVKMETVAGHHERSESILLKASVQVIQCT